MKNILNIKTQNEILERISLVTETSNRLWGKMTAIEMISHCSDQIKMATGEIQTNFVGNFLMTTLVKKLVLLGMPAGKGKIETAPELKQGLGGTKPTFFAQDKENLAELVKNFEMKIEKTPNQIHPAFGKMNTDQWGRLSYIHLNHHLKQFGC